MTMIAQRTFAPSIMAHQQQQQQQQVNSLVRFSGGDAKGSLAKISPKRMHQQTLAQFGTGPLPSIERRNARERNRVRQVNNGFDKLRQYIPAKIVEAENGGRGVSKKLSKVDTLRMAVVYIQRLQEMLEENNSRLPQSSALQSPVSACSHFSPSPAPSTDHQQTTYLNYCQTPLGGFQTQFSEAPVSPATSFHSDVSCSQGQSVLQLQTVQLRTEEETYAKGYGEVKYEDDDSGSFEEDGILDDILQWQMQS